MTERVHNELRKLAEAATHGPWEWEPPSKEPWPSGDQSLVTTWNEADGYPKSVVTSWGYDADGITASAEDRAFIAAVNPKVVLALLDELAEARAALGLTAEQAEQALQRVRELHTFAERWVPANEEKPWRGFIRDGDKCESCNQVYPCPTIKALEGDE